MFLVCQTNFFGINGVNCSFLFRKSLNSLTRCVLSLPFELLSNHAKIADIISVQAQISKDYQILRNGFPRRKRSS